MHLTFTQFLAIFVLGLSLARSSSSFINFVARLKQASADSPFLRPAHAIFASITLLPDFFCSTKAVDFVVLLAKV